MAPLPRYSALCWPKSSQPAAWLQPLAVAREYNESPYNAVETPQNVNEDRSSSTGALIDRGFLGETGRKELLIERLNGDPRRTAAAQPHPARHNPTLPPTALVHDAYARFIWQSEVNLKNRVHFMAIASQLMPQTLVDHSRLRVAAKRGGAQRQATRGEALSGREAHSLDVATARAWLRNELGRPA